MTSMTTFHLIFWRNENAFVLCSAYVDNVEVKIDIKFASNVLLGGPNWNVKRHRILLLYSNLLMWCSSYPCSGLKRKDYTNILLNLSPATKVLRLPCSEVPWLTGCCSELFNASLERKMESYPIAWCHMLPFLIAAAVRVCGILFTLLKVKGKVSPCA
jgi:hypothetical protein